MKKLFIMTAIFLFSGMAFGQTLQKGGVVAIHTMKVTLATGVTMDQYMDFLTTKYFPAFNKEMEGVKFFLLEGDRGEGAGSFATLVWCKSVEIRNRYWPGEGSPSEAFTAILQKLQSIQDEAGKMATYTSVYTEWLIK